MSPSSVHTGMVTRGKIPRASDGATCWYLASWPLVPLSGSQINRSRGSGKREATSDSQSQLLAKLAFLLEDANWWLRCAMRVLPIQLLDLRAERFLRNSELESIGNESMSEPKRQHRKWMSSCLHSSTVCEILATRTLVPEPDVQLHGQFHTSCALQKSEISS